MTRCEHCLNLQYYDGEPFDNREVLSEGRRHRRKFFGEYQGSAEKGCRYCKFIVNAISHVNPVADDENLFIWLELTATGGVWIEWVSQSETDLSLKVYTPVGYEPAWPGIVQSGELSYSPSSNQASDFICARLQDCDDNHPSCQSSSSELPTRMIDVGVAGSEDADYVWLVEISSLPRTATHVPYIALSYCWGIGQSVTTVSSNYEAMKQGICVSKLPPTLRDAITVTRNMGQRYIWIDALCIIQDSSSDWELEAARIASVYQNAYFTISAGTAAAASEGFLEGRQHMAARPESVFQAEWEASTNPGGESPSKSPRKTILAARVMPSSIIHWKYMVNHGLPLNTRGWTMQEKILSRRVITYSTHELQWTCVSLSTCECGYLLDSDNRGYDTISINPNLSRREAFYQWAKIIKDYSSRSLTYAEDKLPAISGVAHALQNIFQSAYLAGHWVNNLPEELAWKAMPPHPPDTDNNSSSSGASQLQYIAPTFSWASLRTGSVDCVYLHQNQSKWTPCCVVESFGSEVQGQNPLGRISSGWITLRGFLVKGQLTINRFHGFYTIEQVTLQNRGKVHMFMDTFLEEFDAVVSEEDGMTTTERSIRRSPLYPALPGPKTDKGIDCPVYLLLLGYWIRSKSDDKIERERPEPDMAFLVLGRSPTQQEKWERIGSGRCHKQFEGASKLEDEQEGVEREERLRGVFGEEGVVTIV